jgi:hypothetical protein
MRWVGVADDRRRHLVAVWNPSVAADAMDAHVAVLLESIARHRKDPSGDDPCVWWGRVRSPNRQGPLPHLAEVLALGEESDDPRETHLYLTDYRSLYVAAVGAISTGDMTVEDPENVPAYYRKNALACDCWFQLWDIRRLVQGDTLAVVAELRHLRNVHYNDRPVSIYGGMVDLPLIVYRDDEVQYFDEGERDRLLDGKHWVEFDLENSGSGALERSLRDDLFGDAAWTSLDVGTRAFVATAERIYRDIRGNAALDYSPVIGSLAKAIEVEANRRLRLGLAKAPPSARLAKLSDETVDVTRRSLTLGDLARALGGEPQLQKALMARLNDGHWFTGEFAVAIDGLREIRNPAIHETRLDRGTAAHWRDRIVGVGCDGILRRLSGVRPK